MSNPATASNGRTVLLADDEEINSLLTQALLSQSGFAVTIVANGKEALAAAHASRFDIILLDIQMPVMDGLEACSLLRQRETKAERPTPIIAITADHSATCRQHCLEHGFSAFIIKPFKGSELLATIAELLPSPSGA